MKITIFILSVFVVAALARPQTIPIVTQTGVQDESGQYAFSYSTGNGIAAAEHGSLKPNPLRTDNILVKTGSFAFVAPDGNTYRTEYISDEGGFRATGAHLPRDENTQ